MYAHFNVKVLKVVNKWIQRFFVFVFSSLNFICFKKSLGVKMCLNKFPCCHVTPSVQGLQHLQWHYVVTLSSTLVYRLPIDHHGSWIRNNFTSDLLCWCCQWYFWYQITVEAWTCFWLHWCYLGNVWYQKTLNWNQIIQY